LNVGGAVWDAVSPLLNPFAWVPVCGLIAHYNDRAGASTGPDRLPMLIRNVLSKSLTTRGFIQRKFVDQRPDFYRQAGEWIAQGKLRYREDVVDGIENAPAAFIDLLRGRNFGKLIVRVSENL
jgi:NADPH-dependent curcumin reductase CurA